MRNAKVKFSQISNPENFSAEEGNLKPEYDEGRIYFVESEGKIYVDFHGKRTLYDSGAVDKIMKLEESSVWYGEDEEPLK